jgi:hypothetical protein
MTQSSERLVPKVHPATRPVEPEDPMTLHATPVAGDPEVMIRCLAQEFAWMGWDAEQILGLFQDPGNPVLYELQRAYGPDGLRARVAELLGEVGVLRVSGTVCDEPDEPEPELIQLGLPAASDRPASPEGSSHAQGL